MNAKQLAILIVALALLGGLGIQLSKRQSADWKAPEAAAGKKLLGDLPVNDIAQITIKNGQGELNIAKVDDSWKVKERSNYPANFAEIQEFLRKSYELKGVRQIKIGASQLGRVELLPPDKSTNSSTQVDLKDKSGKVVKSILLGKKHMHASEGAAPASPFGGDMGAGGWPDGRFVLIPDGQTTPNVWIVSDAMSNLEPKADSWLNKDFFKVEKVQSVAVTTPNTTNDWKFSRETETGEFKLADKKESENLDTTKLSGLGTLLSYASFNDVLPLDAKPESIGMDKPVAAVVETFDHFKYAIKVGKYTNDESFAFQILVSAEIPKERTPGKDEKKEDKDKLDKAFKDANDKLAEKLVQEKKCEKWTYLVSKWTVDQLLKNRAEWIADPKPESKGATNAPSLTIPSADGDAPGMSIPVLPPSTDDKK